MFFWLVSLYLLVSYSHIVLSMVIVWFIFNSLSSCAILLHVILHGYVFASSGFPAFSALGMFQFSSIPVNGSIKADIFSYTCFLSPAFGSTNLPATQPTPDCLQSCSTERELEKLGLAS